MKFDSVIIGSGLAALWCAKYLNDSGQKTLIITKNQVWDANSFYAQGGVTMAVDENDVPIHIEDTLKAGSFHNNKKVVKILSKASLKLKKELLEYGFKFSPNVTREGAHSVKRVYHAGGDATGRELHKFVFKKDKSFLLDEAIVFDLLIEDNTAYGVSVFHKNKKFNIYADNVIIASGGIGALYKYDTNARTISGDMQGLAVEKGIELKDMEMTQFHPTVFIEMQFAQKLLLTEALRGEGAYIIDENKNRFLFEYDERGELASRDIVSRAIYIHQQKGHKVFLDVSMFEEEYFKNRFPTIYYKLRNFDINVPYEPIPISPAFHYMMGGIVVDENSKVKNFKNLYAVGEVANTGVHGANRLASNSLLECFVFAKRAAKEIINKNFKTKFKEFEINSEELFKNDDKKYKNKLREVMWSKVGIIRNKKDLNDALNFVEENIEKVGRMTKLRFLTAREIIKAAINRKKSLGAHYRID
ncbi:L-aspartate oxidase [Caminibacter mediatlanticus]|uniref:L-aspartate oxidase n=1 Tax=Caminibacter mediatlanticus TB-2 TaxID=391592 RepID=A0AAI9F2G8_9BACT|nr:L-aspartate oxidase [Caminibacter mediatlanticus]EDM23794.1 L-aspartate oxidase [Caminibacter mediatlanticus TB-2]